MFKVSIIIPSYNRPDALDKCLGSIFYKNELKNIDIIVYIDGNIGLFSSVMTRYENKVKFIKNQKNYGLATAINISAYKSDSDFLLVVNDDNVFPINFDTKLHKLLLDNGLSKTCVTINQIERTRSIYKNIKIYDCGDVDNFNFDLFNNINEGYSDDGLFDYGGGLFPFLISKKNFMIVNGFDIAYNSPYIMDWDFFLKLELNDIKMRLSKYFHLYHFGSLSTKNNGDKFVVNDMIIKEQNAIKYFKYKWNTNPELGINNTKINKYLQTKYR